MKRSNKINLLLTGHISSPKLFNALQIAQGLCGGRWQRIVVIGSSALDNRFQHLGDYCTLHVAADASPQRYMQAVNIAASCADVVILSSLSHEWTFGVQQHLSVSYFEDLLRSHRMLFHQLRHAPVHIIACVDTRVSFLQRDENGRRKLHMETIVQQPEIDQQFSIHLHLDKRGCAYVKKDATKVLQSGGEQIKLTADHGAGLFAWSRSGESDVSHELQEQIDNCDTLAQLYQLLFNLDAEDPTVLSAFTKRKIQLDLDHKEPVMTVIPGGLL